MTVQDIIKASLRKLAVIASGESPEPEELTDSMSALQTMLRAWAGKSITVFASTHDNFVLQAGVSLYVWGVGSGGVFNSIRPNQLLGASILDSSGVTYPVDLISEARYRSIAVKLTTSRPYSLYFQPLFPSAFVYLYPVPDTAYHLLIDSFKPFTETSSFDTLESELMFPVNYEEAIIYNLAVRLAPDFEKPLSPEIAAIAESSYNGIVSLNAANRVESADIVVPAGNTPSGRYSINSDSYH
jgi:hypothetical protein